MFKMFPDLTKEEVIDYSIKYVNPGKTQEWIDRNINLIMEKREGYAFWDMNGKKYLDIHINGGTFNLGHRNPELIEAMIQATRDFDIGNHHFASAARAMLGKRMNEVTPEGLQYCVFSSGGGEAVDVAIKSARYTTKRKKIISIKGCYHGHTGFSVSTGDAIFKDPFLAGGEDGCFVQLPLNDLEAMEQELKKEDTAAVMIESILATYGFQIPNSGYLKTVKELCEKYGALYIADEVQTGLMRTGKMWSIDHEGFTPDILVTAKGFSGGIYPISCTVLNRKSAKWLFEAGRMHGSTTGGSEIGCMVALKMLEITTRQSTIDNIHKNTKRMTDFANRMIDKTDGFLKGYSQRGVIMGMDFDVEDASKTVSPALFENGVWAHNSRLRPCVLQFKLGLLADDAYMEQLFDKMEKGILLAAFRK
ncbi:aspartate aminotransferase family protein [Faecalicatena contorta]|uniref:Acetylornithine/succinyldiaminopimelate/putrescine aminotransferase n=1 Tax=Faecalicatena contorta TaxID=39482 RepID=A0A315ZQS3_9FIRM|nr:aminotransferase class III-fold pyridoxal phosphate-dependent enzyme [Faecalicatena contorta]PWJ47340.1 acetylornithine/succinyldiaminopimelate/putrescine aminotransferase [Faecalicatena contorta]SUQ16054.1 Acetylornithine/succinyldiaminopimelate/putrescine aminotransferase [Faecalicatena contorta]